MPSLFISYSRKDIETARKLTEAFNGQGLDFWIDWEGIPPTVDWWNEIERGIEQADIFLFLLSPDSAQSKVCKQEIEHAAKNGKRLIPVVVRDIKADDSPTELKSLNWIFLRELDDFESNFSRLITAVKTDYEWVQAHSQLQVKAREWERNNRENGFLLHGKELQDAEIQLVANASKEPHPTELQREYVLKSRQVTDRQRRRTTSAAIVGLIIVAAFAVYGFVQAGIARTAQATAEANAAEAQTAQANAENRENARATAQAQAEERERIARAGELAAQSVSLREKNFLVSILLGVEAWKTRDTARTYSVLLDNTQIHPQLQQYLSRHTNDVSSIAFSPDGKVLASGSWDSTILLWDMETRQPIGQPLSGHTNWIDSVAFSPDGKVLASGSEDNTIILWNVKTGQPIGQPLSRHTSWISSVAFGPDGKILASGSRDSTIILWAVETRQPIGIPLSSHTDVVSSVAFSPDGKILASGSRDSTIILWDVETRQPIGAPLSEHISGVNSVAFRPDGTMLASGSEDGTIILWDVETRLGSVCKTENSG